MKKVYLILLLMVVAILGAVIAFFGYQNYMLLEYQEIAVDYSFENNVMGLNIDTDALHMGALPPGGFSKRRLTITSVNDAHLVIRISGNASEYFAPEQNNLDVVAGEPVTITFLVSSPLNTSLGKYEGVARFFFYR